MLNPGSPSHLPHPAGYPETVIREGSHLTEASWADGTQGTENSRLSLSPCSPPPPLALTDTGRQHYAGKHFRTTDTLVKS